MLKDPLKKQSARIAYSAVSICIVPILSVLYPFFFPVFIKVFKIYGESSFVAMAVVDALFMALGLVTFGILSWLLRGNKRLFVPLLFYLVVRLLSGMQSVSSKIIVLNQDVSASLFTSQAVSLLFSFLMACSMALFLLAFIKHPKKSVRVGAMCSLAGYFLSFISVVVNRLALPILIKNNISLYSLYTTILGILFILLQLVFWVALSASLLRQNRGV